MLMKIARVRGGFVAVLRSSQTPEFIIATTAVRRTSRNDAAKDSRALLNVLRAQNPVSAAKLEVMEITAPSHWASYLIYGDASGLEDSDIAQCDEWIAAEGLGDPVDAVDAGFIHYHGARLYCPLASDCQTYTFLVRQ